MWLSEHILNTYSGILHNKVKEEIVGVPSIELYEPCVLKWVLEIVMDIKNSATWLRTEILKTI